MAVQITIRVTGLEDLQRRFAASPEIVHAAQLEFLRKSRRVLLSQVRANIPVRDQNLTPPEGARVFRQTRSGKLRDTGAVRSAATKKKWNPPGTTRRSVRTNLSTARMSVTVFSRWYVARLLETGTVKMPAQQPFQRAADAVAPLVQDFADQAVASIAQQLGRRV